MQAREIMTPNLACCTPSDSIHSIAKVMAECNIGMLPVVESQQTKRLIGVVTDRDIVCRIDANGKNCATATVQDAMTTGKLWTVKPTDDVNNVIKEMEEGQIRRIPVVDDGGNLVGIIATADIALKLKDAQAVAGVFEDISKPTHVPHA